MRHLWSLIAGLIAAPAVWVLVAAGQDGSYRTVERWVKNDTYNWGNLIEPAVYLAAAAVVLGLIGVTRISPAGPIAAGLVLVAPYAAMFVAPFRVHDAVPDGWRLFGDQLPLEGPLDNGILFFVGATLLMATFSAKRWRPWPSPYGDSVDWQPGSSDSPPPSLAYPSSDSLQTTSTGGSGWPSPRTGSGWDDKSR